MLLHTFYNQYLFPIYVFIVLAVYERWEIYKLFFEESPVALTVVEENGLISYANKKFAELTGYKLSEIIGEHFTKFVAPEDRKRMEKYHEKRLKNERAPDEYEYKCLRKDGEIRYIKIKVIKLPENRTLSCKIDITEEKEAEEIFKKMARTALVALFIYQDDYFVYVNPMVEKLTGYSKEELLKMHFWDLVHEDYKEIVKERGRRRQRGEIVKPAIYEIPYYTKDGKIRWGLFSFTNIMYRGRTAGMATVIDITEIREKEKKFRAIFENAFDGIFIETPEGDILDVNEAGCRMLGYKKEELIGKNIRDIVPEHIAKKIPHFIKMHEEKGGIHVEAENIRKDGKIIPVEVSTSLIRIGENKYVVAIVRDITQRKEMERALKESEEKYRMLVEMSQEGICIDDENENIVFTNEAFAKALGYKREELIGKSIFDIIDEKSKKIIEKEIEKRKRGIASKYEIDFISKDGKRKTMIVSATPLYKDGKFAGSLSVNLDITERKKAEEKLSESEALYRAIAETSKSGIFILQDGKIKYANTAFLSAIGYSSEDIDKIDYISLIFKEDRKKIENTIDEIMKGKTPHVPEFRYVTKDGEIRWAIGSGAKIKYKGRGAFLGIMTDITDIKKIQERERKFIEDTSHYFFNPICIAKGYIDLLKERINGREREMLEKAYEAVIRIEKVVENIVRGGKIYE